MPKIPIVHKDLIVVNVNVKTREEILIKLAEMLNSKGFVKETYVDAILDREAKFPTGIQTNGIGIAIPHADIQHVLKPCVAVGILKNPVKFRSMEDMEEEIKVRIIFMLAIKDPDMQLAMLQRLVSTFRNEELLYKLIETQDKGEIYSLLNFD